MRHITLIFLFSLSISLNAQDCPSGDVSIYCQDQMDDFAAQYPNCTEINGNFRLYGDAYDDGYNFGCDINVNLPNLTRVNGTLGLGAYVSGLDSLQYVSGISVSPTGSATLPSLDSVAGNVSAVSDVEEIYYAVEFPDCPQLKYIGGNLEINTYYGGFDSNKFPALEHIGGNISQMHDPYLLNSNVNVSDFSGMNNLRYVGGNVVLSDGNIAGLNVLDTIVGHFFTATTYFETIPINITGLNQLRYIGGRFELEEKVFGSNCVSDLSGLSELNHVGGDFQYMGQSAGNIDNCNSAPDSINGLGKLKYVGGSLQMDNNDLLHLNFLHQLETVGGNLELTRNNLENIEGLNHAIDIGGELIIIENSNLSECAVQAVCDHLTDEQPATIANNMEGCNTIEGVETDCGIVPEPLCPSGNVYIDSQAGMDGFAAQYPDCEEITGNLYIGGACPDYMYENGSLCPISVDLPNLKRVNGIVRLNNEVYGLGDLEYVGGVECVFAWAWVASFSKLDTVGGSIIVDPSHTDWEWWGGFPNFPQLKYVEGNLEMYLDWGYFDSKDFPELEYVGGNITEVREAGDADYTGFDNLRYVGGDISVSDIGFSGFNALDTLGGSIIVDPMYYWTFPISGFNQLKYIGENLELSLNYNLCISGLSGFESLNYIGGDFEYVIEHPTAECNYELTSIEGMQQLKHVGGSLRIIRRDLQDISFLNQLETIGGNLELSGNESLESIGGLNHAIDIGGEVIIRDNLNLSDCAVQAVCNHLTDEQPATIANNMDGCNTIEEVETNCSLVPEPLCPPGNVYIYCQEDMDNFVAQYPDCDEITGNFTLDGPPYYYYDDCPINVNLPNLRRVNGTLSLQNHVSGLNNLEYVGGISYSIEGGASLSGLDTVGGNIVFYSLFHEYGWNAYFSHFPQLKYVEGNISMNVSNGSFNSNRFPALEYVGGNIYEITEIGNSDFSGFNNLRYVGGNISLEEGSVSGFNALDTLGGDFTILSMFAGINISGFNQLKCIGENMILGTSDGTACVYDLSGFESLNYIGGDFDYIGGNSSWDQCDDDVASIEGMQGLRYIGGSLRILFKNLQNLNFLNQLETIGNDLELHWNNALQSIEGLNHSIDIGGEIIITDNALLSECAVQAVCDHLLNDEPTTIANNLAGCNNTSEVLEACNSMLLCPFGDITLTTQAAVDALFAAYPNCTEMSEKLIIRADYPADISNLDALSQVTSIGGGLLIDNTAITNLNGLQNLTTTGYDLVITNNANLTSLSGLENLTSTASHLKIENNDALTDLSGLDNITQVGESLLIFDNANLQNLSGLNALTSIGSELYLKKNINMTSLSGLENLTSTASHLKIENNDALTDLSGLDNMTGVGGSVLIFDNNNLQNLSGLNALTSIGLQLYLKNNTNLTLLSGLENLTSTGTDIRLQNSTNLTSLSALSNVNSISGYITLSGNDALTSLIGLQNINPDSIIQFSITNNPNLSMCSVSSVCGHIEDNGMTIFSNNAAGCNSLSEVTDICVVSTHTPDDAPDIAISPNPSDGTFTVQGITNATYNILNFTGQIIQSGELKNDTTIDISSEAQGVYFISISIDNQIITKRIVKM